MRCPPISQHHRRGRRAGAEASRLINETGHAPRIGAGNGPGIRGTPRALGQATVHWGRQIAYPNACFPAPMRLTVLGGALRPWSRATECAQEHAVGAQIIDGDHQRRRQTASNTRPVFTAIPRSAWADPQGCPVQRLCFHSNTTLSQRYHTLQAIQHLQSDGIPLRTRHRLQNIPSPRPSTILLCVTKVRRVPQPALHAPGQTRALIGAGNSALEQETDHWGRLITCPNAD